MKEERGIDLELEVLFLGDEVSNYAGDEGASNLENETFESDYRSLWWLCNEREVSIKSGEHTRT